MDVDKAGVAFKYYRKENTTNHHTDEYENDVLVLRRGAAFKLGLTFHNIPPNDIRDPVLQFGIGKFIGHQILYR